MQKKIKALRMKESLVSLSVVALNLLMVFSMILEAPSAKAQTGPQISVDPSFAALEIGDNLTMTVKLANVPELYAWQIALKYNGTVLNLTGLSIPADSVFSGQTDIEPDPVFGTDVVDGLSYIYVAASLIIAPVSVTSGVLFKANFTVLASGSTALMIAEKSAPVRFSAAQIWNVYFTTLLDYSTTQLTFTATSGSVSTGIVQVKPVAVFSVTTPEVDNVTHYVLHGHPFSTGVSHIQSYQGYVTVFNASASYSPNPNNTIATYTWDFDEGNITVTSSPVIEHVFHKTGQLIVTLQVTDNNNPPEVSDIDSQPMLIGMVLDYVNWTPLYYIVIAAIVIIVAVTVAPRILRHQKKSSANRKVLS